MVGRRQVLHGSKRVADVDLLQPVVGIIWRADRVPADLQWHSELVVLNTHARDGDVGREDALEPETHARPDLDEWIVGVLGERVVDVVDGVVAGELGVGGVIQPQDGHGAWVDRKGGYADELQPTQVGE